MLKLFLKITEITRKKMWIYFWRIVDIQNHCVPVVWPSPGTSLSMNNDTNWLRSNLRVNIHWTIYSATSFQEKCKKVVLEKWFFKLGIFFLVNHFSRTRKNVNLWYKTTFFSGQPLFSNQISWTRFFEPDFWNRYSTPL